jgi:hypothetical protein
MYKLLIIGLVFLLGFYFIYKSNDIETFSGNDNLNKISGKCPDVLIQKGAAFFLYNSKRANVPGVNPIRFDSLEEYVEFTEWQRSQGILCPVLYLQHAYNAQGEPVYKARPGPTNLQGGQPDYIVTSDSLSKNIMPPPAIVPVEGILSENTMNYAPSNTYTANSYGGAFGAAYGVANGAANGAANGCPNANGGPNQNYPGFDPQNQTIGIDTPLDKMFNQTSGVSPNPMDDNWGGVEFTENLVKSGFYRDNELFISTA